MKTCSWQMKVTSGADNILADGQPLATYHTESRGDQVEQPVPETNHEIYSLPLISLNIPLFLPFHR